MNDDLSKAFTGIAASAASEQDRLRLVAKSREFAQPLFAVLDKIKSGVAGSESAGFLIDEYSTWGGGIVLQVGLQNINPGKDAANNWEALGKGYKRVNLFIDPEGTAAAVRWDQMKPDRNVWPDGVSPTQSRFQTVNELMPVLAAWVQDNMPQTAKALVAPPPSKKNYSGIDIG